MEGADGVRQDSVGDWPVCACYLGHVTQSDLQGGCEAPCYVNGARFVCPADGFPSEVLYLAAGANTGKRNGKEVVGAVDEVALPHAGPRGCWIGIAGSEGPRRAALGRRLAASRRTPAGGCDGGVLERHAAGMGHCQGAYAQPT